MISCLRRAPGAARGRPWAWAGLALALALGLGGCAPRQGALELEPIEPQVRLEEARQTTLPPSHLAPPEVHTLAEVGQEGRRFSLSIQDGPLSEVLAALSQETDLNITVGADVDLRRPLTVHLKEVTFEQALELVVVRAAGYAWRLEPGFMHITRFEERVYHLDYLDVAPDTEIEIGGDMLASSVTEAGVSGHFLLTSSKKGEDSSVWGGIDRALAAMKSNEGTVWIERNVGMVYLADTPERVGKMVAWLDALAEALHREVFMEARIMEVQLSRSHQYGIDWTRLSVQMPSSLKGLPDALSVGFNGGSSFVLSQGSQVEGLVDFLETQGDVSLLSNPHLSVMNGQTAVMTVGYQYPFGDVEGVDRDPQTGVTTFVTSIKRAVLGLQLGISAQVSAEGVVTMHIVPTITRIQRQESVEIPTTSSRTQSISNPVIDLQEMATVVRVREGDSVVLGGLVSQTDRMDREGLPFLSRIPLLGGLFGRHARDRETRELVVVITPHLKRVD